MNGLRRIAMWSGPRNVSTAMMRAWGNRTDTIVCDEPLYAHYLLATGIDHPGRDEVIAAQETDWKKVVERLTGPPPRGQAIFYQKHMAHHLLDVIDRGWLSALTHCFLIRDPREMLLSLIGKLPDAAVADTGLPQQVELVDFVQKLTGRTPPIVDARDVLESPREMLTLLCEACGVAFDEAMLSWPAGSRATDGVWAKYWYAAAEQSTGFAPYRPRHEPLPSRYDALLGQCREYYDRLYAMRLRP